VERAQPAVPGVERHPVEPGHAGRGPPFTVPRRLRARPPAATAGRRNTRTPRQRNYPRVPSLRLPQTVTTDIGQLAEFLAGPPSSTGRRPRCLGRRRLTGHAKGTWSSLGSSGPARRRPAAARERFQQERNQRAVPAQRPAPPSRRRRGICAQSARIAGGRMTGTRSVRCAYLAGERGDGAAGRAGWLVSAGCGGVPGGGRVGARNTRGIHAAAGGSIRRGPRR
jgi:hypothetical protein